MLLLLILSLFWDTEMDDELKFAYILSTITAIILLFSPFQTGLILLPGFFIFLVLSVKKIRWAQLIWLGIVGYFVYFSLTGVIWAIGASKLYFVATIPISGLSFFLGFSSLDITDFTFRSFGKALRILFSAYFVFFAVLILGKIYVILMMKLNYGSSFSPGNIAITAIALLIDVFILIIPCALAGYYILKENEYGLKLAPLLLVMSSLFSIDPHQKYVINSMERLLFDIKDVKGDVFTYLGYYLLYILFLITLIFLFLFLRKTRERGPTSSTKAIER